MYKYLHGLQWVIVMPVFSYTANYISTPEDDAELASHSAPLPPSPPSIRMMRAEVLMTDFGYIPPRIGARVVNAYLAVLRVMSSHRRTRDWVATIAEFAGIKRRILIDMVASVSAISYVKKKKKELANLTPELAMKRTFVALSTALQRIRAYTPTVAVHRELLGSAMKRKSTTESISTASAFLVGLTKGVITSMPRRLREDIFNTPERYFWLAHHLHREARIPSALRYGAFMSSALASAHDILPRVLSHEHGRKGAVLGLLAFGLSRGQAELVVSELASFVKSSYWKLVGPDSWSSSSLYALADEEEREGLTSLVEESRQLAGLLEKAEKELQSAKGTGMRRGGGA
jgi:hypothetical protein